MIRTERLELRRARPGDLEAMHHVLGNDEAMRFWSSAPHRTMAETQKWLNAMIESEPGQSEDFVIVREGEVIGKIGAYRLPDFGYILHPDHWGLGLAGEAMTAFLHHVSSRTDIAFLTADVDPRNTRSIDLLLRHGFRETGRASRTWNTHIGWCDSIYFRIDFRSSG